MKTLFGRLGDLLLGGPKSTHRNVGFYRDDALYSNTVDLRIPDEAEESVLRSIDRFMASSQWDPWERLDSECSKYKLTYRRGYWASKERNWPGVPMGGFHYTVGNSQFEVDCSFNARQEAEDFLRKLLAKDIHPAAILASEEFAEYLASPIQVPIPGFIDRFRILPADWRTRGYFYQGGSIAGLVRYDNRILEAMRNAFVDPAQQQNAFLSGSLPPSWGILATQPWNSRADINIEPRKHLTKVRCTMTSHVNYLVRESDNGPWSGEDELLLLLEALVGQRYRLEVQELFNYLACE